MNCPYCQHELAKISGLIWFYCINSQCKFMSGYDYRIAIHTNQKDFFLPLPKYLLAVGNHMTNQIKIKIKNINDGFFNYDKHIAIPYFPPDLTNLNKTINRIYSLILFT